MALKKLAEKCRKCPFVDKCDHKQMEAVGYFPEPHPEKAPDKARVFESALGYNKDNCDQLIKDIESHADIHKMVEKGDNGYGMRYEQIIKLKGPNEKEANVLTAWIDDDENLRLTSVYVTKKEETK